MKTDHRETWPQCYRTQEDAGIPEGTFEPVTNRHWLWFAALFALIVVGPAIVEWFV